MTRFALQSTVAAAALFVSLGSAHAADVSAPASYDWTGFYVGGLVGYGNTSTDMDIGYEGLRRSNPAIVSPMYSIPPGGGWINDAFYGDVYNTLSSFYATTSQGYYNNDPMPSLARWVTSMSDDAGTFAGTALAGYNFQVGDFILGGELRAVFGDFGNSSSWSETSGGTKTGYADTEGSYNPSFYYNASLGVLDPPSITPNLSEGADINYSGTYSQTASLKASNSFDYMFAPVARAGFALDRVQFFGMAGPTYANVTAKTSATIDESLTGFTDSSAGTQIDFTADKTYHFSGSNSENMWGFTVGGGSEWAVTDNIILRVEGEYHNLGDITVKGTSPDTESSYKVKQTIDGYSISTGVIFKL